MPDEQSGNIPSFDGPTTIRPSKTEEVADTNGTENSLPGANNTDVDKPAPAPANENYPDRTGPGTGDGLDSRPLGDPNAPQGTGPGTVPGGNITAPAHERPAPAGEVRTSWAEQGHTNS